MASLSARRLPRAPAKVLFYNYLRSMTVYRLTNYVLLAIMFGYAAGLIIAAHFLLPLGFIITIFALAITVFCFAFFLSKKNIVLFLIPLAVIGLVIGVVRFQMVNSDHGDMRLVEQNGKTVVLHGTIIRDPESSGGTARFVILATTLGDTLLTDPTRVL